jgi:TIR domain
MTTAARPALWDVFIAYAREDREAVSALAAALEKTTLTVWRDAEELLLENQLLEPVERALSRSRYGVVLFSKALFRRKRPAGEMHALLARAKPFPPPFLTLLHDVELFDLVALDLGEYALPASDYGEDTVVRVVLERVRWATLQAYALQRAASSGGPEQATLPRPEMSRDVADRIDVVRALRRDLGRRLEEMVRSIPERLREYEREHGETPGVGLTGRCSVSFEGGFESFATVTLSIVKENVDTLLGHLEEGLGEGRGAAADEITRRIHQFAFDLRLQERAQSDPTGCPPEQARSYGFLGLLTGGAADCVTACAKALPVTTASI